MKKVASFLIILIILMLLTPTVMGFTLQGWGVQPGGVSSEFYVSNNNYGLFCINHGYSFLSNRYYRVYKTGELSELGDGEGGLLLSFIIGDMQRAAENGETDRLGRTINGVKSRNGQEWQEYIWELIGTNAQSPNATAYEELKKKYEAYKEVESTKNDDVTIEFGTDVGVANADGMIGPFKVNYQYKEQIDEYIDLKITMTDNVTGTEKELFKKEYKDIITNIITSDAAGTIPFQAGDTEFYISVNDVTYGQKYRFKVEWKFTYYNMGKYWKLTPKRNAFRIVTCPQCGTTTILRAEGYRDTSAGATAASNLINADGSQVKWTWVWYGEDAIVNGPSGSSDIYNTDENGTQDDSYLDYPIRSKLATLDKYEDGFCSYNWFEQQKTGPVNRYVHRHILIHDMDMGSMNPTLLWHEGTVSPIYYTELKWTHNLLQNSIYSRGGSQHNCQDYIFLMTTATEVSRSDEIELLVGQPDMKILLNKINSLTQVKVSGVTFEVSATGANIKLPDGTLQNPYTIVTDGNDTEIVIMPDNEGLGGLINEITVTFTETGLENEDEYLMYRDEDGTPGSTGSIVMRFIWDETTMEWKHEETTFPQYKDNGVEEKAETEDVEKNCWKITAENRPKIAELSGYVWIDGVTGEKNVQAPNGIHDGSEGFKEGVKVYLYKTDGTQVEYDGYGVRYGANGEGYVVTDGDGKYEFKDIPELPAGEAYYIVFKYDGINYICTKLGGDSKATETDRAGFNSNFVTISAGQSNGGIALNYNYSGNASTLITEDGDGIVYDDFAIEADTQAAGNTYNEPATDINLGIVRKVVDLALMTDLNKATASINGKAVEVGGNPKFDGDRNAIIEIIQGRTADYASYNINLYRSDYNYRIGNYFGGFVQEPELVSEEEQAILDSREELEITLEYIIILANQSTTDASVDEFEFYYDSHLVPSQIAGGNVVADSGNTLTIIPSSPALGMGGSTEIKLEFRAKNLEADQVIKNYAEITKYSTVEGGYVDCDSAPGNSNAGSGAFQYEDDSDEAGGVKLVIMATDREIIGDIFEDNKVVIGDAPEYITGNGIYDAGENKIDDVIVQLIEIKDLNIGNVTKRLEYIWQETTSGSNVVRRVSDDGTRLEQYEVTAADGTYVFKGFIPGDYIVRFIYGDGTYYDVALNKANILKYNGQDYKSTIDVNYYRKYLVTTEYGSENSSMARDNEARRLEEMSYALGVTDGNDLIIDSKDKLENTWMAAETSKILVEDTIVKEGEATFYRKVNFGLVARPETKLSLKKHISSVLLQDASGNTIVQAGVPNVNTQYLDDSAEIVDFRSGVSVENAPIEATATTRQNRGYWQVESNSVDGARLTLKYKYIVTNTGEPDYLSQDLVNKFKITGQYEDDVKAYREEIDKCVEEVKQAVKLNTYQIRDTYLGQAYYTGTKAGSGDNQKGGDASVKTYVNIEDYLKDLSLEGSSSFENVDKQNKKIINLSGNEATESVQVIRTKNGEALVGNSMAEFEAQVKTTIANNQTFPSYIAQIITPVTSGSGTKITGSIPNNLEYVQSYYAVARLEDLGLGKGTEADEYWGETFRIIPTTGEDKQSSFALIVSVTTGLAIIVVGIILIRRFIMK